MNHYIMLYKTISIFWNSMRYSTKKVAKQLINSVKIICLILILRNKIVIMKQKKKIIIFKIQFLIVTAKIN